MQLQAEVLHRRLNQAGVAASVDDHTGAIVTFDGLNQNEERHNRYMLPCVWKAIQMVEILRRTPAGLRVDELQAMTGYSRGTIYRILRTLTVCEYAFRDTGGFYRLNRAVVLPAQTQMILPVNSTPGAIRSTSTGDSDPGFERWGVRFHADGSRLPGHQRRAEGGAGKKIGKVPPPQT